MNITLENKLEKLSQKNEQFKKTLEQKAGEPDLAHSEEETVDQAHVPSEEICVCTICADPISEYKPRFFLGTETNPACENCQDSSYSEADDEIT